MRVLLLLFLIISLSSVFGPNQTVAGPQRITVRNSDWDQVSPQSQYTSELSDWPMYQFNAQHTGHNDYSTITLPLTLKWEKTDIHKPLNQIAIAEGKIYFTYARNQFSALNASDAGWPTIHGGFLCGNL